MLNHSLNVVVLLEYFSSNDEDVVLALEYLVTDLEKVIKVVRKEGKQVVKRLKRFDLAESGLEVVDFFKGDMEVVGDASGFVNVRVGAGAD
nr:cyclin-dependent kinase F-1 [Tanacetum cinerariifolium]